MVLLIKTYKVLDADIAAPEDESRHGVEVAGLGSLVESSLAVLRTKQSLRDQESTVQGTRDTSSQNINIEPQHL